MYMLWLKEVPEFTIIFCRLLLVRNLIEQFGFPLILGVAAKGNIRGIQISVFLIAFFPLLFSYFFFKMGFQPYSIYVVFIIYSIIIFIITIYYAIKEFELPFAYFFKDILFKSVITLIFFSIILFVFYYIIPQGILRLTITCTLILIVYFPLIFIFGLNNLEKLQLRKLIFSMKNKN